MTEGELPKTEVQPLKGEDLDRALSALSADRGLNPKIVDRLLITNLEEAKGLSNLDKLVPSGLLAAHLATLAAVNHYGGDLPTLGTLPTAVHELLQAVHNLTVNAANSPAVRDHLPFVFLEAAGGYGALKTLPNWLKLRSKRAQAAELQTQVRERVEQGEMKFEMASGHTAAFVGGGDWLGDRLQEIKPADKVMQYAHLKIDSRVWELMQQQSRQEEIFEALDRGDFAKAGVALIMPVKEEDMFLPGEGGHDMTLDEIESLVDVLDGYCDSRGIKRKRVVIVGRRALRETYIMRTEEGEFEESSTTLGERVDRISEKRGKEVEIIDPTEIVMRKIAQMASGRKIVLSGTAASDERYGVSFFQALKEIGYGGQDSMETVRVLYNITDVPTEVHVGEGDIAVILDASKKETLIKKGVLEESIIVVPDEVLKVLEQKVEES